MTWEQGRQTVAAMIARGELQRVPASRGHADHLVAQAQQHVAAASTIMPIDAIGAYQLLYDAARKALVAVLENEGLRPTSRGGHIAVVKAITAQLDPPHGDIVRPFDRLRRRRNQAEYPGNDMPRFSADEVGRDLPKVREIIGVVTTMLDGMGEF